MVDSGHTYYQCFESGLFFTDTIKIKIRIRIFYCIKFIMYISVFFRLTKNMLGFGFLLHFSHGQKINFHMFFNNPDPQNTKSETLLKIQKNSITIFIID